MHVCDRTWEDLEEEAHVGRTFNRWSQGLVVPPVSASLPCLFAQHSEEVEKQLRTISATQRMIVEATRDVLVFLRSQR